LSIAEVKLVEMADKCCLLNLCDTSFLEVHMGIIVSPSDCSCAECFYAYGASGKITIPNNFIQCGKMSNKYGAAIIVPQKTIACNEFIMCE